MCYKQISFDIAIAIYHDRTPASGLRNKHPILSPTVLVEFVQIVTVTVLQKVMKTF